MVSIDFTPGDSGTVENPYADFLRSNIIRKPVVSVDELKCLLEDLYDNEYSNIGYLIRIRKPKNTILLAPSFEDEAPVINAVQEDAPFNEFIKDYGLGLISVVGLWAYVNIKKTDQESESYPPNKEAAIELFNKFAQAPTFIYGTDSEFIGTWHLRQPWRIDTEKDQIQAQLYYTILKRRFRNLLNANGWSVAVPDSLKKITIFSGLDWEPGQVIEGPGKPYNFSDFEDLLPKEMYHNPNYCDSRSMWYIKNMPQIRHLPCPYTTGCDGEICPDWDWC